MMGNPTLGLSEPTRVPILVTDPITAYLTEFVLEQLCDTALGLFFSFFFVFLGPHPQHMEIPRLGVESEL